MVAKYHQQFCSPYPFHDLFLLFGKFHWRLPKRWLHRPSPCLFQFLELHREHCYP
jgi:hypothetical protein